MPLAAISKEHPDFLTFPDTTPSDPLKHPRSCYDSVESRCIYNDTLENCIKICKDSPFCDAGYFIKNEEKTTCVPLRTDLFPLFNPAYTWEPNSFKNTEITSFVNDKVFPFPPKDVSGVFFNDIFELVNVETGFKLLTKDSNTTIQFSVAGSDVYIGSPYRSLNIGKMMSQPRFGEPISIILDKTILVLRIDLDSNTTQWVPGLASGFGNEEQFVLAPVSNPEDNHVSYNDTFYISSVFGPALAVEPSTNTLVLSREGPERAIMAGLGATFKFVPKFPFYSCVDGRCIQVDKSEVDITENTVRYKGRPVYRKEGCFSVCGTKWDDGIEYRSKEESSHLVKNIFLAILFVLLLAGVIYLVRA